MMHEEHWIVGATVKIAGISPYCEVASAMHTEEAIIEAAL